MMQPGRPNVDAAMIAHYAEHPRLQIPKGYVVRESTDVQFCVVAGIAATDGHSVSTVTSPVGQRHGLVVEQGSGLSRASKKTSR